MSQVPVDDEKLKDLFKTAVLEALDERKEFLRDIIEETMEDIALGRAIEEGQRTGDVARKDVITLLEGGH